MSMTYKARKAIIARRIEKRHTSGKSFSELARECKVEPSDIWLAIKGDPIYVSRKLYLHFYPPRKRCRLVGDVSPELRREIRAEADRLGLTMGEMVKALWLAYIGLSVEVEADWER